MLGRTEKSLQLAVLLHFKGCAAQRSRRRVAHAACISTQLLLKHVGGFGAQPADRPAIIEFPKLAVRAANVPKVR